MIRQAKKITFTPDTKKTFNECLFYVSIWLLSFILDEPQQNLNNRINGSHERALNLVYNDFSYSFSELLEKDKSVTIHHCNLQTVAYEIFEVKNNMAPEILTEIFPQKEINYSIRNSTTLQGRSIKTVTYVSEPISILGPKI